MFVYAGVPSLSPVEQRFHCLLRCRDCSSPASAIWLDSLLGEVAVATAILDRSCTTATC
ncbi:hypothetical protein GGD62_008074 [Bradyrhizobium sp. ERR14]|nr:hypothetical protein [Bradyrhizobium sp. ERR14]